MSLGEARQVKKKMETVLKLQLTQDHQKTATKLQKRKTLLISNNLIQCHSQRIRVSLWRLDLAQSPSTTSIYSINHRNLSKIFRSLQFFRGLKAGFLQRVKVLKLIRTIPYI